MKISIIIPCYNNGRFLKRCLDSIINEQVDDLEIICVNDGSTDDTIEQFNRIKYDIEGNNLYPYITLINQENKGASGARNTGIREATGEYLCFVDPDDMIEPGGLIALKECAIKNNFPDLVAGGIRMIIFNGEEDVRTPGDSYSRGENTPIFIYEKLSKCATINSMSTKLYKSDVIKGSKELLDEQIRFVEDACYNAKIIKYFKSCATIDVPTYRYILNDVSTTFKFKKNYVRDRHIMNLLWEDFLKSNCYDESRDERLAQMKKVHADAWLRLVWTLYRTKDFRQKYKFFKQIWRHGKTYEPYFSELLNAPGLYGYLRRVSKFGTYPMHLFLKWAFTKEGIRSRYAF